jgi:hypothetical protein
MKRIRNTKKWVILLMGVLLILGSLLGCSSDKDYASDSTADFGFDDAMAPEVEMVEEEASENRAASDGSAIGASEAGADGGADLSNRKIIEIRNIYMETLEFDTTTRMVEELLYNSLGYIETSNVTGKGYSSNNKEYDPRYAYFTLRVPAEYYEGFVEQLITYGYVVNNNVNKQDVTTQYLDLEARIETMEIQEERLLSLLEQSARLEDILELERELADVRYEIESYTTYLNDLDNKVRYSTVYLEISEVFEIVEFEEVPVTFGERISSGFSNSIESIVEGSKDFAVWFIGALPILVIWFAIIFGIYKAVRIFARKLRKKPNKSVSKKLDEDKSDENHEDDK